MTDQPVLVVFVAAVITLVAVLIAEPVLLALCRIFGVYAVVQERTARVYMLFGKVVGILDEPGLYFLPARLGASAFVINLLGNCYVVDLRLDQEYLRSQPVNSEEGAPMGIGVWYEMWISDPVAYLFKNADPRGSLRANVSNATVRNLSNLKLSNMLEDSHSMSTLVRDEVSEKSKEWGYSLGTVYVRKVHFRDASMIQQIAEKVVNRLRQVTSAIRQDGTNQVNLITSTAERQAAVAFAKAAAMRPFIVGSALNTIAQDKEVAEVMFEILENQRMLEGKVNVTLIPPDLRADGLTQYLTAGMAPSTAGSSTPPRQVPGTATGTPPPISTG